MSVGFWKVLVSAQGDGAALTAAAAASAIPAQAKVTIPASTFQTAGQLLRLRAHGRISCAVTTPGTARFDLRFGGTVVFDTLAMPLNIVAKSNVSWELDVLMTFRSPGSTANFISGGTWRSEAVIASPLPSAGGSGIELVPYNTAPVVGSSFDSNAAQQVDFQFTQTVATGSMTLHQFILETATLE